ncbi:MAG: ATP-dependent DNA helicase [Halobacteriota archaeon]|nr:ATP-dependent DNA helicase [Halobacteriota archaeon]
MKISEVGLSDEIVEHYQSLGISDLYPPQVEAIKLGLLEGRNILTAVPTASGKTLIAELAMLKSVLEGGKAIYIVPLRALASEKYERFSEFRSLGIRVGISTSDFDTRGESLASNDIIVVTSEKMDSLMRNDVSWASEITVIVVDEIHLIDSASRGPTLEIALAKLRRTAPKAQILALSATISNADELSKWLDAAPIRSDWRPVELREGVFFDGVINFKDENREILKHKDDVASVVIDTLKGGGQCLIFESTRRFSEGTADKIGKAIRGQIDEDAGEELKTIATGIRSVGGTELGDRLARSVENGSAFHHAGLRSEHRRIVEDGFRTGTIKVITSTPTLAAGINLPARRVIIKNYRRYEANRGSIPIPVLEYKQMCGRAGRPELDPYGEAVLIAKRPDELEWLMQNYVSGRLEDIWSKLGTENALRTHLLSLIASRIAESRSGLMKFLSETFYAFQQDTWDLNRIVDKTLLMLCDEEMIVEDGSLYATNLGRLVSRLYIDPLSASIIIDGLRARPSVPDLGLIHLICKTPDLHLLYLKRGDYTWINDLICENHNMFVRVPDEFSNEYEWFLSEVKTAAMIHDWICEKDESVITEKFGVGPGDIRNIVETAEWIMHSTVELSSFLNLQTTPKARELSVRIRYGVERDLLDLLRIRGVGRVRARRLYNAGYTDVRTLRIADIKKIKRLLGDKIAENIMDEVRDRND